MYNISSARSEVVVGVPTPATVKKIQGFSYLQEGWHYGNGTPPTDLIIGQAISVNNLFIQVGLTTTNAFPGVDGEIMVTAYKDEYYIECIVEKNGNYSITAEEKQVEFENKQNVAEKEAIGTI